MCAHRILWALLAALGQPRRLRVQVRRAVGFTGKRRPVVSWMTLFGVVSVASVYMRSPGEAAGYRPMKERLGVEGGGKSRAVERALTDFGIDESFGAAAAKFEEHYGTTIHRTTIRRTVLDNPTYVAQVGDIGRFARTLALAARHRGADDATSTYAVTDGGNGLREGLEGAMEIDQYILDKRHCRTHLLDTATEMRSEDADEQARDWLAMPARGEVEHVIWQLDDYRTDEDGPGADRVRQLRNHLIRFQDAVSYDHFVDQGMVIGSGEVESGHRHVTQRRLKIAGAWWAEENLDPIVALRTVRANGWWDEFCREAA